MNLTAGQEIVETAGNPVATQDNAADTNGNMTVDFGFRPTMSLCATVFADVNADGVQTPANPLEDGLPTGPSSMARIWATPSS